MHAFQIKLGYFDKNLVNIWIDLIKQERGASIFSFTNRDLVVIYNIIIGNSMYKVDKT